MVQGVGFRPHIYRLAITNGLAGEVANSLAGVELVLTGQEAKITMLLDTLQSNPPPGSLITSISQLPLSSKQYTDFKIVPSRRAGNHAPLAPADFGMCAECEKELLDSDNQRFQHPFISCTACGPRFTLLEGLPYDRSSTSMSQFPLCRSCQEQYTDPASRRFHAEPICCPDCGPRLSFYGRDGMESKEPLTKTATVLSKGGVVAVKGVGGFHLAVDACNDKAVSRLRAIKKRPDKPLAIMVRDLKTAASLAHISGQAGELLCSARRPIVIVPAKAQVPLSKLIAPVIPEIGIMLAYTPLHFLLFNQGPEILVMTSYNEPGDPMLTSTTEALARLGTSCDAVLSNNRKIINRCDDSVLRMHGNKGRLLRRSRGYVPLPVELASDTPAILACGAGEKLTFCLTRGKMAFLSQHLGDTNSPASQSHYQEACSRLQELLHITPQLIAHDLHPDYYSSRFAQQHQGLKKFAVQHHHGHIASCMAENKINHTVLGLALDGTGLGADGSLWGGEILRCTLSDFKRLAHFAPLAMPGSEAAIREPWRLALAWLHREGLHQANLAFLAEIPEMSKMMAIEMLDRKINCPQTSSLGRLFDAVAALINLRHETTFSAQAAMELEALCDPEEKGSYRFSLPSAQGASPQIIETTGLLHDIIADLKNGTRQEVIAGRFHNTIITMLTRTCLVLAEQEGITEVACSGGVFQNRIVSQGLEKGLSQAGLTVHCHRRVPCNDGGLALGQAAVAAALYQKGLPSATSGPEPTHA